MFQFIDICAKYIAICPYYKPTSFTYFLIISFLILFCYAFILPLVLFILSNSWLFMILFVFFSCYYLAEINRYYEEKIEF